MRKLNLWCVFVMLWLLFCSKTMASSVKFIVKEAAEDNVMFHRDIPAVYWGSRVTGDGEFHASGNLYMAHDYAPVDHSDGFAFDMRNKWGELSIVPGRKGHISLPDFDGDRDGHDHGVALAKHELLIDFWTSGGSAFDAKWFFSEKHMHAVSCGPVTAVPVPAASLLFASALTALGCYRRAARG